MNIKVALTNLGKYNEGELVYEWVTLPIEIERNYMPVEDSLKGVLKRIGIGEPRFDGGVYEECFISDYEAPFEIGEYESLSKLNEIAEQLEAIDIPEAILTGSYDGGDVKEFAYELESAGLIDEVGDDVLNIVDDYELEELTKGAVESRGWVGAKIFLSGIDMINDDYYLINGYGNAENLTHDYLEMIVDELMDELKNSLA